MKAVSGNVKQDEESTTELNDADALENNDDVPLARDGVRDFAVHREILVSPEHLWGGRSNREIGCSRSVRWGVHCGGDYTTHRTSRFGCEGHGYKGSGTARTANGLSVWVAGSQRRGDGGVLVWDGEVLAKRW